MNLIKTFSIRLIYIIKNFEYIFKNIKYSVRQLDDKEIIFILLFMQMMILI